MDKLKLLDAKLDGLYKDNSCDHDIGHARRVVRNAKLIGEKEGAKLSILVPAAMLHDIALKKGFIREINPKHAIIGAKMAEGILLDLSYEKDEVEKIVSVIRQHSIDNQKAEKRTLEGDCLYDADKLDAITVCGVGRTLQFKAIQNNKEVITATQDTIEFIKSFKFLTKTGQELGKDRSKSLSFCQEIIESGKI